MTYSGCPSAYEAKWQLDDFLTIGITYGPTFTLLNYNTGIPTDGPFNVRVILYDATGAVIATSLDVSFFINNFGLGNTITVTSPANFQSIPTVTGTKAFSWTTTYSATSDLENLTWSVDGQEFAASSNYYTNYSYDTTKLINGPHLFVMKAECIGNSTGSCGTVGSLNIGGTIPRLFIAFVVNVQNGTVLRGVQPSVSEIEMAVGGTYSLNAVLAMTDGTTTNGTFNLTMEHACLIADPQQTELPFPCTSGNSYPGTSLEGGPYISLSSSTLTSGTPITINALAVGESYLTVTDSVSGKSFPIPIAVKDTAQVRHLGTCGTIYSSYTPGGSCPSIVRTAIENSPNSTMMQQHTVKSGLTAVESQFWVDPGNGGTPYANFAAWLAAWQSQYQTPINSMLVNMPGICVVLRGETLTRTPQELIDAQLGPSATTWSTDPLPYALSQLFATNRICGGDLLDEAQIGYVSFNDVFSAKFSDSSISKIVVKSGEAIVYPPAPGSYPHDPVYGANFRYGIPNSVLVRGATTSGFNGAVTPHCLYHALWNTIIESAGSFANGYKTITAITAGNPTTITANGHFQVTWPGNSSVNIYGATGAWTALNGQGILPNSITYNSGAGTTTIVVPINTTGSTGVFGSATITPGPCTDPNTHVAVEDSFTFGTSAADGTYTSATDPNIELLAWGGYFTGYSYDGSLPMPNNAFSYINSKFRAAGIPENWPVSAASDIISSLFFQLTGPNNMADYNLFYEAWPVNAIKTEFPWGLSFINYYNGTYVRKWGSYKQYLTGTHGYWQGEGLGYVYVPQTVPQGLLLAISAMGYVLGGTQSTISTISGSTLTTSAPHNISAPGGGYFNYIKATIAGNSDSTMNGHWYVYPTGTSTVRLFAPIATGCASSGAFGTATIRNVPYTIIGGYSQVIMSTSLPADLIPGELVTISGAGASCANATWAFVGWASYPPSAEISGPYTNISISPLANSSGGSGGTVLFNSDQGAFNPLYDYAAPYSHRLEAYAPQLLYSAGLGFSIFRIYQAGDVANSLGGWKVYWPNDGNGYQAAPTVDANAALDLQQRWWAGAPALNLLKIHPSLFLQNVSANPWIAPGPPYVVAAAQTSATYGNSLTVWNASEILQQVSIPLGTFCQIGTNPISVYEIDWPHSTTNLLTGAQTNYSLTMNPGEVDVFACHAGTTSFVQAVPFTFFPPAGTATTSIQVVYGNYNQPLASYSRSVSGSGSPITLNLDTGWSDVWFRFQYLNSSNAVIGSSDFERIPQH